VIAAVVDSSRGVPQGVGWDLFRILLGTSMGCLCISYLTGRSWARRAFHGSDRRLGHVLNSVGCLIFGIVSPLMALSSLIHLLTT
jgi:hypothetical protein